MCRRVGAVWIALVLVCLAQSEVHGFSMSRMLPTRSTGSQMRLHHRTWLRCQDREGDMALPEVRSKQAKARYLHSVQERGLSQRQGTTLQSRIEKAPLQVFQAGVLSCILLAAQPALSEGPYIIDDAKVFGSNERVRLEQNLQDFQAETDYRIRVLTRDARAKRNIMSTQEIKQLWSLPDPKAVVVILDASRGNVLNFNSGERVSKLLPDRFFSELTGRLGNLYAVRDEGENGVVEEAVDKIEICLRRSKGCYVVPGIGKDQYALSFAASCAGGLVFGASLLTAAQFAAKNAKGSDAIFKFAPVLFSPLWVLFGGGLGLNPLLQRGADANLIAQNLGGFGATALVMYLAYPVMLRMWGGYL